MAAGPRGSFTITYAGDSVLLVEFEERMDPDINERAVQLASALESAHLKGVRDVVPTFRSVGIHFDPLRTDLVALAARVEHEAARGAPPARQAESPIRIPVCYGGAFGPDLADVAAFAGLTVDETIAYHTGIVYRVFMLGFLPGFPYLGAVDPRIAMPRKATPRTRVPEGSVGIAGRQTGVYPCDTPGGWQIIGRTPIKPFDLRRQPPFLLKAGDHVQFYPIASPEFERARDALRAEGA
jgi:inhibitor of KinA